MWQPKRVLFEAKALDFPRGREMEKLFRSLKIPTEVMGKTNRVTGIPDAPAAKAWTAAKDTLVVRVRDTKKFETCKPSAHYQLPLASSCPGKCEYCYLHTTLGAKPYLRAYVNIEEILDRAGHYIKERLPEETTFEGAATSDPVPLEPFTGALAETITWFGEQEHARFRFVTKFTCVETLLSLKHNGRTRFRYSVNTDRVIKAWEHGTPSAEMRLGALELVAGAGYPMGLIVAPVVLYEGWEQDYRDLFIALGQRLKGADLTLEIILHRYTDRAKKTIIDIFPSSTLPMDGENRVFKYGQFGYRKHVYNKDLYQRAREIFAELSNAHLPQAKLEYLV